MLEDPTQSEQCSPEIATTLPTIKTDTTEVSKFDENIFPISIKLISQLRNLDALNDEHLGQLKSLLEQILSSQRGKPTYLNEHDVSANPNIELYSQTLIKIHQVSKYHILRWLDPYFLTQILSFYSFVQTLTLVKVKDFEKACLSQESHLEAIAEAIQEKGCLDYTPSEQTPTGRQKEHASDCRTLFKHLLTVQKVQIGITELQKPLFFVAAVSKPDQKVENAAITIEKSHIDLVLKANGKAELYFHAYFWTRYVTCLQEELTLNPKLSAFLEGPEINKLRVLAKKPSVVIDNFKNQTFGEAEYHDFVNKFGGKKDFRRIQEINKLTKYLFYAQMNDDKAALQLIEKLLIQLLGYQDMTVRDQAVGLLNVLYDQMDWQAEQAFVPVVRSVGQHFKVQLEILHSNYEEGKDQIFVGVSAPSPLASTHTSTLTWHLIAPRNIKKVTSLSVELEVNCGKFWKCGFFDWRVVLVDKCGKLVLPSCARPPTTSHLLPFGCSFDQDNGLDDQFDMPVAQGRFVVHSKGIRDQCFHEVQVDYQNAQIDFKRQTFAKRGTFTDVENSMDSYQQAGVTALYLMGVFQRDNLPVKGSAYQGFPQESSLQTAMFRKADAAPLAVTDRVTPCEMLGGEQGFKQVVSKAKQSGIKVIVDCLARISSSRHHRKFRDLLLSCLDEQGIKRICYGTDGHAQNYEDTAMLNYRKVEAWNLLISEVLDFAQKTGIDGIHLDNGQAWPQILQPDLEELRRVDVDGCEAYSAAEVLAGEIVIRNENHGYWNTNAMETYPNPFFVKLCRQLWTHFPQFTIIGECWGGHMFENRQIILARSGVIPRLFSLPQTLCSLMGKKLHRDGRITPCEKESVLTLRQWHDKNTKFMPEGSILMQSSTSHNWPYPAYLYGKAVWAAVDVLYFLPDIPITFMDEVRGDVYRIDQSSMFQADKAHIQESRIKKSDSQILLALQRGESQDQTLDETASYSESQKSKGLGVRVRSRSNLAALVVEQKRAQKTEDIEGEFKREIGPETGFDLSQIESHYRHRRMLRSEKMVLRYGKLVPLVARQISSNQFGQHDFVASVLSFARYSRMETIIVATNLSDQAQRFFIDLSNLQELFRSQLSENLVVIIQDLLSPETSNYNKNDYFFLKEFLLSKKETTLAPSSSSVLSVTICSEDKYIFQKALQRSIQRTHEKLRKSENIESDHISQLLSEFLRTKPHDIGYFASLVGSLQNEFLDRISMNLNDLFVNNSALKNDPMLTAKLMALTKQVKETALSRQMDARTKVSLKSVIDACTSVHSSNQLGPIVFCTPELGRWSTAGGLGVMVDELSVGLAKLGQEVIVISPYYDRNRKGVTNYLKTDPAGFEYIDNITVQADASVSIGVHEGSVSNVKLVFLHHAEIFPSVYPALNAANTVRMLTIFAKACLEYCCKRQLLPSVCVTNDWFTGFIPGYAKTKQFGPTFDGTSFIHICHNLQESYEGRIYPEPRDGGLEFIHGLPRDILIDQAWAGNVINPSRCAIMMSDQWATVSKSYKEDLMNSSPLSALLRAKPNPFAFPNGIPIKERIQKLDAASPNHLAAKEALQKNYFNYAKLNDETPLFAFVGRITSQKGVHLILDAAEQIIEQYQHKVQFLVGGPGNMNDPYSRDCSHRMWSLKQRYPHSFWAAPEDFFTDGSLVNRGADFGLMPSLFEPGGIVQHEFFVGATPVVAFKTGGLKDSVIEFEWESQKGCGFTFESYRKEDFVFAIERAIGTFQNKQKYAKLRENAFRATMPGELVCKAWLNEFFRLRNKVYYDWQTLCQAESQMESWKFEEYKQINIFDEMFGHEKRQLLQQDEDYDMGAEEGKTASASNENRSLTFSPFDLVQKEKIPHNFMLHNRGRRHQKVELVGTFDDWKKRHAMTFDNITNQWFVTLHLAKGEHYFKYVIDNKHWVVNEEDSKIKDKANNENNYLKL